MAASGVVCSARDVEHASTPRPVGQSMTAHVFPFAGLLTAHDATPSDAERIDELARILVDAGAAPVIVAVPPDVEGPARARVVRTRAQGSPIAAIRLGMAQLTNTVARAVLLVPLGAEGTSLVALLALVDAAKRDERAIVTGSEGSLDGAALLVPRDAWLELVTLGEGGMDAVATRRRVLRVGGVSGTDARC
jgi:hypothetical protein